MNPYWLYPPHPTPNPYPYNNYYCDWDLEEEERDKNRVQKVAADTTIKNSFDLIYGTDQWSLPSSSSSSSPSSLNQRKRRQLEVVAERRRMIEDGQNFVENPAKKCECRCGGCGNSEKFQTLNSQGSTPFPSSSSSTSSASSEENDEPMSMPMPVPSVAYQNNKVTTGPPKNMTMIPVVNYGPGLVHHNSTFCHDLVNWLNGWLTANYVNVEELCDGAAYCQFMDMLFPGSIPMHKVKFQTRLEHEYIHNFKILQRAFQKLNVDKRVPIVKLIQGDFGESFAFLQWFKNFFDTTYNRQPYNAFEARGRVILGGHPKSFAATPLTSQLFAVTNHNVGQQIMCQDLEESQHHSQLKCGGVGGPSRHRQCCNGGWYFSYPDD